ncbi:Ankyrin-1 [Dactylellina cionopaga]|nr:Ankyrin-1 [Dactylellina cionopaga]
MHYPPLHQSVLDGDEVAVSTLLKHTPTAVDTTAGTNHWTPLHFAAYYNQPSILRILLSQGASTSSRESKNGFSPLHKAAERGNIDIIKDLLAHCADIEALTDAGSTPLLVAVKFGHKEVIELLISRGADMDCCNHTGQTAAHIAADKGHKEILKLLYEKGSCIDEFNGSWRTPLYLAVKAGNESIVRYLLDQGCDVNACGEDGWTTLHAAAFYKHKGNAKATTTTGTAITRMLLASGATATAKITATGYTPLHKAAEAGNLEVIKILVGEKDVNVNEKSVRRHTPLYAAVRFGKDRGVLVEVARFLVGKRADIGVKDVFGMGVESIAKQKGYGELAGILDAA